MVSLISLPFSLGIAIASGVPPIAGVYSAIIAGLILPFVGGSYVTISGPAVGLAPAIVLAIATLGDGDTTLGYVLTLATIFCAGLVQVVMSWFRLGRFGDIFPNAGVKGMLIGIGLLAITKQLPLILGVSFTSTTFWGIVREFPLRFTEKHDLVFLVGMVTLCLLFGLTALLKKAPKTRIPTQVVVVVMATLVGSFMAYALNLDSRYLIPLPAHLWDGFVSPDFAGSIARMSNYIFLIEFIGIVFMFVMIDSVESLATVSAIDKEDKPYYRKSNPNRTLFAMGLSNCLSSLIGGLTIIPGGIKSKANIEAGGKTQWANFWNAIFLALFLVFAQPIIKHLPLGVLGAIVIYIGWKLCAPRVWLKFWRIGKEQFLICAGTALTTVSLGILEGIAMAFVIKMLILVAHARPSRDLDESPLSIADFFRNPVARKTSQKDDVLHIYMDRSIVCFSRIIERLGTVPTSVKELHLHLEPGVRLIDHTAWSALWRYVEDAKQNAEVEWHGLDDFRPLSEHPGAMRVRKERRMSICEDAERSALID
jgi:carbonic anhydrase